MNSQPASRIYTEEAAAELLQRGGSRNATARTVRWLLQQPDAPSRPDFQVDLDALADYLRRVTDRKARGLKAVAALFDKIVPAKAKPRALTYAERQAKSRAKSGHNDIRADLDAALEGINWKSRKRAERDLVYFFKTYCTGAPNEGAFLETPPPPAMQPIVRDMQTCVGTTSMPYHIRQPRGTGKTAYTKGTAKWATATGKRHYLVAVGANSDNADNIIEDIFAGITENPNFVRDWPEISIPFLKLQGAYQRAKTQKYRGEPTNCKKTESKIVLPTIRNPKTGKLFPSSGAIIEAVGFSSGARGKGKMTIRPDFLFLDDLQNDDNAESEAQVAKIVRKVKRTFMGLAGHRKAIAAIMTSTPIEADDVSETFAKDRGWKTKTYKLLIAWPTCHDPTATYDDEHPKPHDWWDDYADVREQAKNEGKDPNVAGNRFYAKHRKEMDAGAKVLNPKNYDPDIEKSALQHAMNLLYRDGLATFMSEYQMEPPRNDFAFEISSPLILKRIRHGIPSRTIPPETVLTLATTDINPAYGLTTTVVSYTLDLVGFVTAYHVTPCRISGKLPDEQFNDRVKEELARVGRELSRLGVKIDRWGIDAAGRQFNAVTSFAPNAESICGIKALAMYGRAGQNWNPNVQSRIRRAREETVMCRNQQGRRWLAWNADAYKERAQLAWSAEIGARGGFSLFDGGANHSKFAAQVANERLKEKTKLKGSDGEERWKYEWKTKDPHDYGDCLAMSRALAANEGLTADMNTTIRKGKPLLAIGGRIPAAKDEQKAVEETETSGQQPEPLKPRKHRIAIGGRLY